MKKLLLVSRNTRHQSLIDQGIDHDSCKISQVVDAVKEAESLLTGVNRRKDFEILVLDLENDGTDALSSIERIMNSDPLPIVMFVEKGDRDSASQASATGASAYVVDGLLPERIEPILAAAVTRFQETNELRDELARARANLEERKVLERAKGLLMEFRGCTENEAFSSMRKLAMSRNKTMVEISRGIIDSIGLIDN